MFLFLRVVLVFDRCVSFGGLYQVWMVLLILEVAWFAHCHGYGFAAIARLSKHNLAVIRGCF